MRRKVIDENTNSNLNNMDIRVLSRKKRSTELNKEIYKIDKEQKKLDTQIDIDKINFESDKLDAVSKVVDKKVRNARTETKLTQIERAIQFNKSVNENDLNDIKKTKKKAKSFKRKSLVASIISAATTCAGLTFLCKEMNMYYFLCITTIMACVYVNYNMSTMVEFKEKFFNKTIFDKSLIGTRLLIALSFEVYSVVTNYLFWQQYIGKTGAVMFSIIYDLISIEFALESSKYESLSYNNEFRDRINVVMNENCEGEDSEKKLLQKKRVRRG